MRKISWRHHYLPQFYLKGFLNGNGKFIIYNVEKQRFVKNGKEFSPESYFFEKDGNSIILDNEKDDFLETSFSQIDNLVSILFDKIRDAKNTSPFGLKDEDMPALQYFIGTLFWRNPKNYDKIKKIVSEGDLKSFGVTLINDGEKMEETIEFEEKLRSDPNFIKRMKIWIPNVTYLRILDNRTPLTIQSFPKGLPSLCSDYPIIFRNPDNPDVYSDDFIFPLTNDLLFIRANKINNVISDIKIEIDLIILKQAIKYVSCTNPTYILMLNKLFKNYESINDLIEQVFRRLID